MKIKDILNICDCELIQGNKELELINFSKDTRNIKKGDIYLAIKGDNFDGNLFYEEAFDKGAEVCILEKVDKIKDIYKDKTIILVKNTIKFIQKLATYKRSLYNIPVIAITGSVGKTSTKDMIYKVVSSKYKTFKTIGNYNNHIGVPLTILSLTDEKALIVEMGMNHEGELKVLTNIAKPTMAVITNIGTAHIGNLGSKENILKAKLEIIEGLEENGTLFINNDNDLLHNYKYPCNIITVGIKNKSDYNAHIVKENVFSSIFDINNDKNITVNIGGEPFIYNSLIAYAVGKKLNIEEKKIKESINTFVLSPHRLEKKENKIGTIIIDDTYNANYDSMKAALDLLGKVENKRKIAVIGDILELGEYSKEIHKNLGKCIYENNIDILITVGKETLVMNNILKKLNYKGKIYNFNKEFETYDLLDNLLTDKDIILLKGSHGINLINIVDKIMKI